MAPDESAPARPGRRTVEFGAFLTGLLIVALSGRALTPWPDDFAVTPKVQYLREHPDDFNAVFIGRSHVFRSFIPELIDGQLAAAGFDLRTFNLGGPGMSDMEIDHVLRTVLAIDGLDLDYVFIEAPDWIRFANANLSTNRAVNWHTLRQTGRVIRAVFRRYPSWIERADVGWPHVEHLWLRFTGYGQGKRIAASLLGWPEEQPLTHEDVERERGYQAPDEVGTVEMEKRRAAFVRTEPNYRESVASISTGNREPHDLDDYDFAALEQQIELIRAAGARPIYVVPPGMDPAAYAYALDEAGHLPDLMRFNDPDLHPRLYRFGRRFDGHLNRLGAEDFSRLFATKFLDLVN
jgi:hypothetical protein